MNAEDGRSKIFAKQNKQAKQLVYNVHSFFKLRKQDQSSTEYQQDVNLNKFGRASNRNINILEKWVACNTHVQKIEDEYCQHDRILDDAMDEMVINLQDNSDSSSCTDSEDGNSSDMHIDISEEKNI
ncbi:unnamed protein product [Parnassius apollo]|uniref:(apollo) hypothetical protein n=1 Tax=Parnassius apollo TaxID=110799 RepID=A0A8S3XSD3_PARAO|nr:unnamed protein product [Parnassius apollo]